MWSHFRWSGRNPSWTSTFLVVAGILLRCPLPADGPRDDARVLFRGSTVEGEIGADGADLYRAELDAGASLFLVTQHGDDVVVMVVLPDGERRGPFNSPAGRWGTEAVLVDLDDAGTVGFELRSRYQRPAGRYTVTLERLTDDAVPAAAGELLDQALDVLRRKKPAGDWTLADAESLRGSYLVALGRFAEAESLLLSGYQRIRDVKDDEDVATLRAKERVDALYQAWGKDGQPSDP